MRRFRALYADPPWTFATRSAKGRGRSADRHYPVLSLAEIKAFPLPAMADDSVLFLWTTDPLLPQALEVMIVSSAVRLIRPSAPITSLIAWRSPSEGWPPNALALSMTQALPKERA